MCARAPNFNRVRMSDTLVSESTLDAKWRQNGNDGVGLLELNIQDLLILSIDYSVPTCSVFGVIRLVSSAYLL